MPWFYFIPYKLESDMERKSRPRIVEGSFWNGVLYVTIGLILVGMAAAFVILPAVMAMGAGAAGGY